MLQTIVKYLAFVLAVCVALQAQSPWPGQGGNAVGYAAFAALNATSCGSLPAGGASWAAATTVSNCTFSSFQTISNNYYIFQSVDFKGTGTTGGTLVSGSHILFLGCRFQSNDVANYNVQTTGADITFIYSSFVPLASFATSPPGTLWPTAASGTNANTFISGTNSLNGNDGYEYGINITSGGPVYVYGADIWGYGNAIVFYSTTAQMTVVNSWIHDPAEPSVQGYHTDGPGYLNGSTGPTNILLQGNTIAMLGNTNSLAFQAATGGYTGLKFNSNYFSGNEKTVAPCLPGSTQCTGTFARNVIGTDVMPGNNGGGGGILYSTAIGSNLKWTGNTIGFRSGTTWTDGDGWTPTSGMNGQYWLSTSVSTPNSATDQAGNAHTGSLAPSSLVWIPSGAASQTVTLTASNTGNVGSISISLATGTQFSQTNNCGSSIASGANCTITITYAPTGSGPVNDTLLIADNDPSSPEPVALVAFGTPSSTSNAVLTPSSLAYGNQPINTNSAVQVATLQNTGSATLNISSIAFTGTNTGDFSKTTTCGSTLAASASCTISVTFTPGATSARSANLVVTDDSGGIGGSTQTTTLTGTGTSSVPGTIKTLNVIVTRNTISQ